MVLFGKREVVFKVQGDKARWKAARAAVEMETAGLYWTAQRLGKKALSILTISDHIFTGEALSAEERQDSFHEMMEIALETAWKAAED